MQPLRPWLSQRPNFREYANLGLYEDAKEGVIGFGSVSGSGKGFMDALKVYKDQGPSEGGEQWWLQHALPFVGPLWQSNANGDSGRGAASTATTPAAAMPDRESIDLFGVREAIAQHLFPEGALIEDVLGATYQE